VTDPLFLATAVEAVLRAGAIQASHLGAEIRIDKKGKIDLVTEVDVAVERMVRALIGERFPDHDILAEEFGGPGTRQSRHCWILDPLDGTTNYAHGLPVFCCTLGLEIDGVVEVGAVYDPCRKELFTATRGGGAFLNGRPLRVSRIDTLVDALLVTGFPYTVHGTAMGRRLVSLFQAFLTQAQAVRRLGSAALDLCYVAAGRFDGFWENSLKPWDVAAGSLIVEEAGGRMSTLDGRPFDVHGGQLLASNGALHDAMIAVIAEWNATNTTQTDGIGS
jgi:myo-inositol-1(or 4)-monophosphatase